MHPRPTALKISVLALLFFVGAFGQPADSAGGKSAGADGNHAVSPNDFPLKAFAAIGSSFVETSQLDKLGLSEAQITAFLDGVGAAFRGKSYASDETAKQLRMAMGQRLQELEMSKQQQTAALLAKPAERAQYMKAMRKRFNLELSDSGLAFNIQTGHLGVRPRPGDSVVVSCEARAADGVTKLPQLSNDRVRVKLETLLPGFMEGFQMMTADSSAIFLVPPELSFGEGEWPEGVPRGTPIFFMVTLHEVIGAESPR